MRRPARAEARGWAGVLVRRLRGRGRSDGRGHRAARGAARGRASERAAARHLERAGYRVLARNARAGGVEVDLLCLGPDGRTVVIVEVKSGRAGARGAGGRGGSPARNLRPGQRRRLVRAMGALVRANGWRDRPRRIDVVTVEWPRSGPARIAHHAGAVSERV